MKLYWLPLSPYARKVAIVAREHQLADRIDMIETKVTLLNLQLMQHNPLNKIPTLVLKDGTALYDSFVICEYLESIGAGPRLFPSNGSARWDALRRHSLGSGLAELLIAWRVEMTQPSQMQSQERLNKYAAKATRVLEALELQARTPARTFDIGDISIGCALAYLRFRFEHLTPAPTSALHEWLLALEARPSFAATRIVG